MDIILPIYNEADYKKAFDISKVKILKSILLKQTKSPITLENYRNFVKYKIKSPEYLNFLEWYTKYQEKFDQLSSAAKARCPLLPNTNVVKYRLSSKIVEDEKELSESSSRDSNDDEVSLMPLYNDVEIFKKRFLEDDSEDGLNISSLLKRRVLTNLCFTTHPEAFRILEADIIKELSANTIDQFINDASFNVNYGWVFIIVFMNYLFFVLLGFGLLLGLYYGIYNGNVLNISTFDPTYYYRILPIYIINFGMIGLFFLNLKTCPTLYAIRMRVATLPSETLTHNRIFQKVEDPTVIQWQWNRLTRLMVYYFIFGITFNFVLFII